MTPLRIDRSAVLARLHDVPGWIIETLLDAFEPAALAARDVAEARAKARKSRAAAEPDPDEEDDA